MDEWFNTKAFALPAQYTFGNAGAYITNADGIIGIDMALEKKFPIRESHAVEFRTEFFNVPNLTTFAAPNANIDSTSGGQITAQGNSPRQIQFALKYSF